jgi:ubiquinone/menaquinone biosynthesis methyltransferase
MTQQKTIRPTDLLQKKEQVPFHFDRIAKRYDVATFFSQGYLKDLQRSVDRMQLRGNEHLADLCCGTGKSTLCCLAALPKGKVTAVDNSSEMLIQAKKNCYPKFPQNQLQFMQHDVMNLDLEPASIDAIFMAYGIRNMPDYRLCLQNLFKLLKPGGIIAFHEYSINDTIFARVYWKMLGYGLIIPFSTIVTGSSTIFKYLIKSVLSFPSPEIFEQMLQESGFSDIKRYSHSSWRKPILHTFIARKP